jgi:hypothetical protein
MTEHRDHGNARGATQDLVASLDVTAVAARPRSALAVRRSRCASGWVPSRASGNAWQGIGTQMATGHTQAAGRGNRGSIPSGFCPINPVDIGAAKRGRGVSFRGAGPASGHARFIFNTMLRSLSAARSAAATASWKGVPNAGPLTSFRFNCHAGVNPSATAAPSTLTE